MLQGKTVLITGSGHGIGFAAGRSMARAGARVAFNAERSIEAFPELHKTLAEYPDCVFLEADLREDGGPEGLVDVAWQELGGIDVLVNNVGTYREPAFLEITRNDFDFVFGLNLWTAIATTQALVRKAQTAGRGGRILFTTSLNATRSEPAHTLYDASKGAMNALTRQLAIEFAPLGFTTAAVAPGLVQTPLTDFGLRSDPAARQAIESQIPIRKIAAAEDIAEWFVFLASDAASYSTGSIHVVDGGLDAQQMPTRPITAAER
ncbi:MAG: SDR family NAD(P)-dependent oxidoreductase [Fimbriiglobus sp.]